MSGDLRKTLSVGEWEYGRPFPEEELLAHIYRSGVKNPKQSENSSKIEINKSTEEMDDIELFMTQLSQQLQAWMPESDGNPMAESAKFFLPLCDKFFWGRVIID